MANTMEGSLHERNNLRIDAQGMYRTHFAGESSCDQNQWDDWDPQAEAAYWMCFQQSWMQTTPETPSGNTGEAQFSAEANVSWWDEQLQDWCWGHAMPPPPPSGVDSQSVWGETMEHDFSASFSWCSAPIAIRSKPLPELVITKPELLGTSNESSLIKALNLEATSIRPRPFWRQPTVQQQDGNIIITDLPSVAPHGTLDAKWAALKFATQASTTCSSLAGHTEKQAVSETTSDGTATPFAEAEIESLTSSEGTSGTIATCVDLSDGQDTTDLEDDIVRQRLSLLRYRCSVEPMDLGFSADDRRPRLGVSESMTRTSLHSGAKLAPKSKSRSEEVERKVLALLNKICPDNLAVIVDHMANIEVCNSHELQQVIALIHSKASSEPCYSETYADMVFHLKERYPAFQDGQDGSMLTFQSVLLQACLLEFGQLPEVLQSMEFAGQVLDEDDKHTLWSTLKSKLLANTRFIGHLFLRHLLSANAVTDMVVRLIGSDVSEKHDLPSAHCVECACELLSTIGHTFEGLADGQQLMAQFLARLKYLQQSISEEEEQVFNKRIQYLIQDLVELQQNGWQGKIFHEKASTKAQLRKEIEKQFSLHVAGLRPGCASGRQQAVITHPKFTLEYVKQVFRRFAGDKIGAGFDNDWWAARPTESESWQGLLWLLDIGSSTRGDADLVIQAFESLLKYRSIQPQTVFSVLAEWLLQLDDLRLDSPHAVPLAEGLSASVLMADDWLGTTDGWLGIHFLWAFQHDLIHLSWTLLPAALERIQAEHGSAAVAKLLADGQILYHLAATDGTVNESGVLALLREKGLRV